ncbi:hypothetical protein [Actinocrispum sp. NPDC049592]
MAVTLALTGAAGFGIAAGVLALLIVAFDSWVNGRDTVSSRYDGPEW